MDVWVDGPRETESSRKAAHSASVSDLPHLTDQERTEAQALRWPEEFYARNKLAGEMGAREWAQRAEALGFLLQGLLQDRDSRAVLESVLLETRRGRYRATVCLGGSTFWFAVREEVVDDLMEAGKLEALENVKRIVDIAALPYLLQLRVS